MIATLVLNYNDSSTTERLVDSIVNYDAIDKIVIVDNCSSDKSFELLSNKYKQNNKIDVIQTKYNGGYGYGNNYGLTYIGTEYHISHILICNPDVYFEEKTVNNLENIMCKYKDAAVVAPMMLNTNNEKVYSCAWRIPTAIESASFTSLLLGKFVKSFYYSKEYFESGEVIAVECVAGSMFMININKFPDLSIFDEKIFLFCEETILGIIVKKLNCKMYLTLNSTFVHAHSVSIKKAFPKQMQQYKLMWKSRIYMIKEYLANNNLEIIYAYFARCLMLTEKRLIFLKRRMLSKR